MNKNNEPNRKALGKGLSALLPSRGAAASAAAPSVHALALQLIDPNPLQPRTVFQPERLEELADSIRANGIIQPLIVQRRGDRYQLVAGERRWRAAKIAEVMEVPVIVREYADDRLLELALIENIQREDLNPIETAQAFERLGREMKLSHEEIGRRTGKDRTTITNLLRLLKLPDEVQLLVAEQRLSMGHARAILALPDAEQQKDLAWRSVDQGLSVRQVEKIVQAHNQAAKLEPAPEPPPAAPAADPNIRAAIENMERRLGTKVRIIERTANKGRIEIEYYSQDELDRLYAMLSGDDR